MTDTSSSPDPGADERLGSCCFLLFDMFGTLVDWRSGVAAALAEFLEEQGWTQHDPLHLADRWRALYQPAMQEVRAGRRRFVRLDTLHRENLETMLRESGIALERVAKARLDALSQCWHRLPAWPDVAPGLARLARRYRLAPLSNGNLSLLIDLARLNALHFDAILGAEVTRTYKPDPHIYLETVALLDLRPDQVMMVAAHETDLAAARGCGLRTAYVDRPREYGDSPHHPPPQGNWDYIVDSLEGLADALAARESQA